MRSNFNNEEFDDFFKYFLDTYVYISNVGTVNIPSLTYSKNENYAVTDFINNALPLLSSAYFPTEVNIYIECLFYKYYGKCKNDIDINKIVISKNYITWFFNYDFDSMMDSWLMWSDNVKRYFVLNVANNLHVTHQELYIEKYKYNFDYLGGL